MGVLDGLKTGSRFALAEVAISASGTAAYLPVGAQPGGVIVQRDRTGREETIVGKPGSYNDPRLSPDGRRVLFYGPDAKGVNQLWIYDRASLTTRQLTFDGVSIRPTWSPDGNRVAFSGERGSVWHTMWMPADGSRPAARVSKGRDVVGTSAVSWTRDGKWIVVDGPPSDGKGAGGEDVFAIPTTDTSHAMRPAVASPANEQLGEVSPDGKWIAFNSDDAGQYQVYIQPFLAPGGRTLISTGNAEEPAWLSNNELVYLNRETDSLTLAHLTFGRTIEVTRTPLFSFQNYQSGTVSERAYDVSRDGKDFILVKPLAGREAVAPVVVLNWTTEVKRLMAAAGVK